MQATQRFVLSGTGGECGLCLGAGKARNQKNARKWRQIPLAEVKRRYIKTKWKNTPFYQSVSRDFFQLPRYSRAIQHLILAVADLNTIQSPRVFPIIQAMENAVQLITHKDHLQNI